MNLLLIYIIFQKCFKIFFFFFFENLLIVLTMILLLRTIKFNINNNIVLSIVIMIFIDKNIYDSSNNNGIHVICYNISSYYKYYIYNIFINSFIIK